MMSTKIDVVTYDGFKGNERPAAVLVDGSRLRVEQVERSWITSGVATESAVSYGFEVRCEGDARFRLVFTPAKGWQGIRL